MGQSCNSADVLWPVSVLRRGSSGTAQLPTDNPDPGMMQQGCRDSTEWERRAGLTRTKTRTRRRPINLSMFCRGWSQILAAIPVPAARTWRHTSPVEVAATFRGAQIRRKEGGIFVTKSPVCYSFVEVSKPPWDKHSNFKVKDCV